MSPMPMLELKFYVLYFLGNPVAATDPVRNQWLRGFGNSEWRYLPGTNTQSLLNPKVRGYIVVLLAKSPEKDLTGSDIFQVSNLKPISSNYLKATYWS